MKQSVPFLFRHSFTHKGYLSVQKQQLIALLEGLKKLNLMHLLPVFSLFEKQLHKLNKYAAEQ